MQSSVSYSSRRQKPYALLAALALGGCVATDAPPASAKVEDKRIASGGTDTSRATSPSECEKVTPHAQNIYIQWARSRAKRGMPVTPDKVSALMGYGRFESGGGRGVNFATVAAHENEKRSNRQGYDGNSFGTTAAVNDFVNKYKTSQQDNFGGLQMAPSVITNYRQETYVQSFVNSHASAADLYSSCLTDMAYSDKSSALREVTTLYNRRAELAGWFATIAAYRDKSQEACRGNEKCTEASKQVGKWLAFCPHLNLDMGAVVSRSYYGTASQYAGGDSRVCKDMIVRELRAAPLGAPGSEYAEEKPAAKAHDVAQPI